MAGTFFLLLSALLLAKPASVVIFVLGLAIFQVGNNVVTAAYQSLLPDRVPKDLGLWTASTTLPAIIAPLLGSLIIALSNVYGVIALGYRLVFGAATLFLLSGAVFILWVRERQEVRPTHRPHRAISVGWKLAFQTRAGKARGFLSS